MRLRQKAFIIIFTLTLALTTVPGVLFLRLLNSDNKEREIALASDKLDELASELDRFIAERRDESGYLILSSEDISVTAKDYFNASDARGWLTLTDGRQVGNLTYDLTVTPKNGETAITFTENGKAVIASSVLHFEDGDHILNLYTETDTSYTQKYAFFLCISAVSISFLCALFGAFYSLHFEKKLERMNIDAAKMVSDRSARFGEYRQPELDRIASSVNTSADALSDDMEKLKTIADGRKQFTDNLAHEMKTPLTSILGFADILRIRRSVDDRTRMEYANIIFEEARRMKGLSGKLLELATAGNTKLDFESIEVPVLFDEIRLSVLPLLAPRQMTLKAFPAAVRINIDRELFKSLLYNLIENAAKASAAGSEIRLICEATHETINISVSDNGCGMTQDQIRRATEPFYMVDKSRSRKAGGAGLGLALCAEIAKKHRARMVIQSKQGKGTTVTLIMLTVLASQT